MKNGSGSKWLYILEVIWFPMVLFIVGSLGTYFYLRLDYIREVQLVRVENDKKHDESIGQLQRGQIGLERDLQVIMQKMDEHFKKQENKK